ncbi:MAG: DinB family protein [Lacipirellulaceae bacterium]
MNDTLRTLYAFNLGYCQRLVEDITEEELLTVPTEGVNPPGWLLGHLAICTDYALANLGAEKQCPEAWHKMFGPKSKPAAPGSDHPSKAELMEALETGHKLVTEASMNVSTEQLSGPNPIEFLRGPLPTVGDLLAHLMATHEASHIGHLSNWRRQMGRPPLF